MQAAVLFKYGDYRPPYLNALGVVNPAAAKRTMSVCIDCDDKQTIINLLEELLSDRHIDSGDQESYLKRKGYCRGCDRSLKRCTCASETDSELDSEGDNEGDEGDNEGGDGNAEGDGVREEERPCPGPGAVLCDLCHKRLPCIVCTKDHPGTGGTLRCLCPECSDKVIAKGDGLPHD